MTILLWHPKSRRPSFDNLLRLADALEVSTDFLLGRTANPEDPGGPVDPTYTDFLRLDPATQELVRRTVKRMHPAKAAGS